MALRTEKIAESIAREILQDIQRNRLEPGSMLPAEGVMVERFGVGRGSLREALRILEVNGLVTLKPGPRGGPVVAAFDPGNFGQMMTLHLQPLAATYRQLIEARLEYESVLARKAAENPNPEVRSAVRKAAGDPGPAEAGYITSTSSFHAEVGKASGNPVLALAADSIYAIWSVRVTQVLYPEEDRARVYDDHDAIARAIERGEPKKAERLMRAHMTEYLEFCERRYPAKMEDLVDWK